MKKTSITIVSWNVNGIRAGIRKGTFEQFLSEHDPDILCLQETRTMKEQVNIDFPQYKEYWHSAEKKGYSGTAIFSKQKAVDIIYGLLPHAQKQFDFFDDKQRNGAEEGRVISAEFETCFVVSVYTPNTKDDLSRLPYRHNVWDPAFLMHVQELEKRKPVIFCGDLNVAHSEIDLARPKENVGKHGFTDEERAGFDAMLEAGFIDTFRDKYPDKTEAYSWWSNWGKARERNVGWRIDYVCASKTLKNSITDAFILPEVMGSDHCPVGIKIQV